VNPLTLIWNFLARTYHRLASPREFYRISCFVTPIFGFLFLILCSIGAYYGLFVAPADYQQGETVRIMYIHVPAAWLAMQTYIFMAITSFGILVWRHPVADVAAKSAAPIGAAFTFLALFTGAVWGKPMWGTWWVWDARLTSVLILFLMYIGLIMLRGLIQSASRGAIVTSVLTLAGIVIIPVIKFSVEWWNTLHQPASVFRSEGSAIHPSMLWPLLIMALAYTSLFVLILLMRMKNEIRQRRIDRLERQLAFRG